MIIGNIDFDLREEDMFLVDPNYTVYHIEPLEFCFSKKSSEILDTDIVASIYKELLKAQFNVKIYTSYNNEINAFDTALIIEENYTSSVPGVTKERFIKICEILSSIFHTGDKIELFIDMDGDIPIYCKGIIQNKNEGYW